MIRKERDTTILLYTKLVELAHNLPLSKIR